MEVNCQLVHIFIFRGHKSYACEVLGCPCIVTEFILYPFFQLGEKMWGLEKIFKHLKKCNHSGRCDLMIWGTMETQQEMIPSVGNECNPINQYSSYLLYKVTSYFLFFNISFKLLLFLWEHQGILNFERWFNSFHFRRIQNEDWLYAYVVYFVFSL